MTSIKATAAPLLGRLRLLCGLGLILCLSLPVAVAGASERWIVAQAYVAEIVVALGGAERIVGLGGNTDHLKELSKVPRLPGFRQTSAEPMLALGPTHVLMTQEWIVPQTVAQLRAAGVRVELLDAEHSPAGVERRIRTIAMMLGKTDEGERLVARFRQDLAAALRDVGQPSPRPRALFMLAGGKRPLVVGGRGTNVAALLEMAGAENVARDIEGFKPMSQEVMVQAAPEFILTNKDGLTPAGEGVPIALKSPGTEATPAGRERRLIHVPDRYLGGMGIHTPEGIRLLHRQLFPRRP